MTIQTDVALLLPGDMAPQLVEYWMGGFCSDTDGFKTALSSQPTDQV